MRLAAMLDVMETGATAIVSLGQHTTARVSTPGAAPLTHDEKGVFNDLVQALVPCRNDDPELWFAEQAGAIEQAKALCQQCPLVAACLQGALDREEPWGVWGGEVFVDGAIVARKRGRGRPRKSEAA